LAVVLAAVLVCGGVRIFGAVPAVAAKDTLPDGFIGVYTAQDLYDIRNNRFGNYCLMDDINLASWGNWEPIGTYSEPFQGMLLGNGHVIQNLSIQSDNIDYAGLFGVVNGSAIHDFVLKNVSISINNSGSLYVGGIAGYSLATITQCGVTGNFNISSSSSGGVVAVGGIVGNGTVSSGYFSGAITVSNPIGGGYLGGIAGISGISSNCYSRGTLNGEFLNAGVVEVFLVLMPLG